MYVSIRHYDISILTNMAYIQNKLLSPVATTPVKKNGLDQL